MGGNSSLSSQSYFSKCDSERDIIEFDNLRKKGVVGIEEEETEGENDKKPAKKRKWFISGISENDADDDILSFQKSMKKKEDEKLECAICYDDEEKSKFVHLKCKHSFHKNCVLEWMKGIPSKGDLFKTNNCRCPMCRSWIFSKKDKDINKKIAPIRAKWKKMMSILMEAEIDDKHKEILRKRKNEKDVFFDFMKDYQFFLCFQCESIYFGGMKNCARDLEREAENEESIDPDEEQKKIQREKGDHLCVKCKVKGKNTKWPTKCKKHGDSFIVFKCRYCCNIANWFCFGTTHFCERCHRQYPNNKVFKCNGAPECDGMHIANGKEQCLGCILCRKGH